MKIRFSLQVYAEVEVDSQSRLSGVITSKSVAVCFLAVSPFGEEQQCQNIFDNALKFRRV